jgi:ATP-dependent Zn protease
MAKGDFKSLYKGQPGTALGTLVGGQTVKYHINSLILHNTTTTDAVIKLNIVPSAGTAGVTNQLLDYTVTAKNTVILNNVDTLEVGATIQGLQVTASAITAHISGLEVS